MREDLGMHTTPPSSTHPLSRDQWTEALRQLDLIPTDEDFRRQHARYGVVCGEVQIEFHPDNDTSLPPVRRSAPIYDLSLGGLMARCLRPIPANTRVRLRIALPEGEVVLRGVVRHSTQTIGGYRVGIELLFDGPAE